MHRYDKNFLFIKYEDMKQDTKGAIIQIADFLGKSLSEDAVERVVELSSLKSMKTRFSRSSSGTKDDPQSTSKSDQTSAPSDGQTNPPPGKKAIGAPAMIRKGIVGDWKTMFTVAQNEELDELFREKMAGSGLTIQFD